MQPRVAWNLLWNSEWPLTQRSSWLCPVSTRIISKSHITSSQNSFDLHFLMLKMLAVFHGCLGQWYFFSKEWFGSSPHVLIWLFVPFVWFTFFGSSFILDICLKAILLVNNFTTRSTVYIIFYINGWCFQPDFSKNCWTKMHMHAQLLPVFLPEAFWHLTVHQLYKNTCLFPGLPKEDMDFALLRAVKGLPSSRANKFTFLWGLAEDTRLRRFYHLEPQGAWASPFPSSRVLGKEGTVQRC